MPQARSPRNRSRGSWFAAVCLAAAAILGATGCTSGGPPQSMETVEAEPVTTAESSGGAASETAPTEAASSSLRPVDGERLRGIFESMADELLVPGAVMLLRERVTGWLERTGPWKATIFTNGIIMTLFLWHMTAYLIAILALWPLGFGHEVDTTARWWLERPVWILVPGAILAAFDQRVAAARKTASIRTSLSGDRCEHYG